MKKILISTVCNDDFILGGLTLLQSLKNNVSILEACDVKIYYDDELCKLSPENKDKFARVFPRIKFQKVNLPVDLKHCTADSEIRRSAFVKLECFNETNYDRVVFLDSDIIVIRDISDIIKDLRIKYGQVDGNTGVLFLGKECLQDPICCMNNTAAKKQRIYDHVLDQVRRGYASINPDMMEQPLINTVIESTVPNICTRLPEDYNLRNFRNLNAKVHSAKIIHWAHYWK